MVAEGGIWSMLRSGMGRGADASCIVAVYTSVMICRTHDQL